MAAEAAGPSSSPRARWGKRQRAPPHPYRKQREVSIEDRSAYSNCPNWPAPPAHGILGHVLAGSLVAGIAVKGAT
jgi:hypothetical protein